MVVDVAGRFVDLEPLSGVTQITAGWSYTCALIDDGTVRCWGDDAPGQPGIPTTIDFSSVPVTVVR